MAVVLALAGAAVFAGCVLVMLADLAAAFISRRRTGTLPGRR